MTRDQNDDEDLGNNETIVPVDMGDWSISDVEPIIEDFPDVIQEKEEAMNPAYSRKSVGLVACV
jgi:hypothetical protein